MKHSTDPIHAMAVAGNIILVQYFVCEEIEVCILLFHERVFHPLVTKILHAFVTQYVLSTCSITVHTARK